VRRPPDRPTYPDIKERINEDPARFLAGRFDPMPRIRGIGDLGVANAWLQVARDLDVREGVVRAIERRRDQLLEDQ